MLWRCASNMWSIRFCQLPSVCRPRPPLACDVCVSENPLQSTDFHSLWRAILLCDVQLTNSGRSRLIICWFSTTFVNIDILLIL